MRCTKLHTSPSVAPLSFKSKCGSAASAIERWALVRLHGPHQLSFACSMLLMHHNFCFVPVSCHSLRRVLNPFTVAASAALLRHHLFGSIWRCWRPMPHSSQNTGPQAQVRGGSVCDLACLVIFLSLAAFLIASIEWLLHILRSQHVVWPQLLCTCSTT